jgi:CMP-N-acetylneuraminic acid synthetase
MKVPHQFGPGSLMIKKGLWLFDASNEEKILRRQEKPIFYARNGAAIYVTRRDKIADFIFGGNVLAYEMDRISSIDIDDIEDWRLAEIVMFGLMNSKFQEPI